jgi:NADP-dependent aldehyde dehydrogenase
MPDGVFSLLFGAGHHAGQRLVAHEGIRAVAFTGSRKGGRALAAIAQARPEPIPFFAEMSSVNPVFLLPHALDADESRLAAALSNSITLGVGQFCTNPGILLVPEAPAGDRFASALGAAMKTAGPACMLNAGIAENYRRLVAERARHENVKTWVCVDFGERAGPALFEVSARTFLRAPELAEEVFGPSSLLVRYGDIGELMTVAAEMEGNLTATILSGSGDERAAVELSAILERKVGRILFGGVPTGVEVCHAITHGGPFPATSDGRSTSVGGRALDRFVRPVCWQDAAEIVLPEELWTGNPAGIWRLVNGKRTQL